ncbi:hypothetical protein F5Y09DRAFT_308538 [Xylaria sp. FL1042]|nr:hypothetical protein F5Y09DRAFT_308538 [Xylaria sp. FL1042]
MMKVRLANVDIFEVLADIQQRNTYRALANDLAVPRFNTSFHTKHEAPDLPARLSEQPYSFKRWLPLILRTFTRAQARLLLSAAEASIQSRHINRLYREDLDEEILPILKSLSFSPDGLFMRLEACSAKDGAQGIPGNSALRSVDEILLLLLTSVRARNAHLNAFEAGIKAFELFFTPWNGRMRSEREYRVFCPPFCPEDSPRISAISQYAWHKNWVFNLPCHRELREQVAEKIAQGSDEIRK